jgi:phage terminase large subunit GpA-like protein
MRARELGPHDRSWLRGEQARVGRDYGSQISSLYGLFQGWGDFAAGFLQSKQRNQQTLRQFINEDLAETWEPAERRETWEQIGTRIIEPDLPRGVVPDGFSFITIGCDKQKDHYVYVVAAWGPGLRCHVVDYGTPEEDSDLLEVCKRSYSHADGGDRLKSRAILLDSGFHPRNAAQMVVRFRAQGVPMWLCRGSSTKLDSVFKIAQQGKKSYMPGLTVVWVDSSSTQDWMDGAISAKDEEKPLSLFAGSLFEHEDFISQILNDAEVEKLDSRNNATVGWNRINENVPNDDRDALRYAYAAAVMLTRCGDVPQRQAAKSTSLRRRSQPAHLLQRPGGWVQGMNR